MNNMMAKAGTCNAYYFDINIFSIEFDFSINDKCFYEILWPSNICEIIKLKINNVRVSKMNFFELYWTKIFIQFFTLGEEIIWSVEFFWKLTFELHTIIIMFTYNTLFNNTRKNSTLWQVFMLQNISLKILLVQNWEKYTVSKWLKTWQRVES